MWKRLWLSFISICISGCLLAVGSVQAAGQTGVQNVKAGGGSVKAVAEKKAPTEKILINLASRSLALYVDGVKTALYPIGPGKVSTPTPVGYYKVQDKAENPVWIDPEDTTRKVPSGETNPLGYRWIQFSGTYGIHGTNRPESVGSYVSNGCVRMKEADVEELFKQVQVGTPIEISYNRVVIEKIADGTVVYYIYPDGYSRQPLDAATVDKWLAGYGVNAFESDSAIEEKIQSSDGEPTYIAKAYGIKIDGRMIEAKAVRKNDICYLPAVPLAEALQVSLNWNPEAAVLVSPYGQVSGTVRKDQLYFNGDDVTNLFQLTGGLTAEGIYEFHSQKPAVVQPVTAEDKTAAVPVKTKLAVIHGKQK